MSDRSIPAMLVACHDCGEVQRVGTLPEGTTAVCPRCGGVLLRHRAAGIERALALSLAGLLLFGVANLFPVMTLKMGGNEQTTTLLGGALALHRSGLWELAGLVLQPVGELPAVLADVHHSTKYNDFDDGGYHRPHRPHWSAGSPASNAASSLGWLPCTV